MTVAEIEEMTNDFLKEHDPYYTDKKAKKSRRYTHPYLTPSQVEEVGKREYPFSCLSVKQTQQCLERSCELGVAKRDFE